MGRFDDFGNNGTTELIFGSGKWGVGPELQFSAGIWAVPGQTLSGNKSG